MPQELRFEDAHAVRLACRRDELDVFPSLTINGRLCVNIVMMDVDDADDFHEFCRRNAVSCPLIDRIAAGERRCPERWARDCDLTTDLRSYDVIEDGQIVATRPQVSDLFTDRTVSFLIGSSVSFDGLLEERGWEPSWGPCIYQTSVACETVGRYSGSMAVTMRSFAAEHADAVAAFTGGFPTCHGGPIGRDNPRELGIADDKNYLLPPPSDHAIPDGHVKLYWACGITPSIVAQAARLPRMIVHTPGNAMVTDVETMSLFHGA